MKLAERQRLLSPIFSIVVSIAFATSASAQRPLNVGFERLTTQGTGRPWGWSPVYGGGDVSMDTTVRHGGSYSLRVTRTSFSSTDGGDEWASLRLFIPPLVAQRNLMQLTVWTRAEGSAMPRVAIEAWAPGLVLSADSEAIVTQRAATAWTKQRLRISNVDTSTFAVVVTVGIQGSGTVWFDDLSLEVGGRRVESVPVAPAFTGGNVAWIDARTVTLTGVEPPSSESVPAEDLAAVDKIIGSARVIALGEDTHGTSEFFQLKDRVLRYLVERRGLRIFAIEANQLAVEGINRYVHGAAGNARTVMRAMFQVWNTTEMEALVEWMRARNAQYPSDQVSFVGYDMQDPSLPIDSVQAFLDRRQPELSASVRAMYVAYREAWRRGPYPLAPDSVRKQWRDDADSAWRIIRATAPGWMANAPTGADSQEVSWVLQNANVVRQAAFSALTGRLADRDSSMSENIRWILDRSPPDAKVLVWAHNAHVGRGQLAGRGFYGGKSMGAYLSRILGEQLRVFGLVSYAGNYRGTLSGKERRSVSAEAVAAPIGTYEEVLHRIAKQRSASVLVADLRDAQRLAATASLRVPRPTRVTGYAVVDFDWEQMVSVPEVFDALLFVDRSTASTPIVRR